MTEAIKDTMILSRAMRYSLLRAFSMATFLLVAVSSVHADVILLRDGNELNCTIKIVTDDEVRYLLPRNPQQMAMPIRDVYRLHFAQRKDVYIAPDGKRITKEKRLIPKGADKVYLVNGDELPAYGVSVEADSISFMLNRPGNGTIPMAGNFSRDEVFKIVYRDGSTDIITRLDAPAKADVGSNMQTEQSAEYQAVVHTTTAGEALSTIAARYGVTVDEIKEWNSMDASLDGTASFSAGRQLMIYVLPIKK